MEEIENVGAMAGVEDDTTVGDETEIGNTCLTDMPFRQRFDAII